MGADFYFQVAQIASAIVLGYGIAWLMPLFQSNNKAAAWDFWAVQRVLYGANAEDQTAQIVCVCKTEEEADQRAQELANKYGLLYVVCLAYAEDLVD